MADLYKKIGHPKRLYDAWQHVRASGINSRDFRTSNEIKIFEQNINTHLRKINDCLKKRNYQFEKARGFTFTKPGKSPRPIVVASICDRIVQRSILGVLNSQKFIKKYVNHPRSFGGLENKGVRQAIEQVCLAIKNGAKYYLKSDVIEFFRNIPRKKVLDILNSNLSDNSLVDILDEATTVELKNVELMDRLYPDLFPRHELGVGQGFCLSPLLANITLLEFDTILNASNVICIRYIDDFMILGATAETVNGGFKKGLKILKNFELNAYRPDQNKDKSQFGPTKKAFDFLGCAVSPHFVHPNKKAKKRIISKAAKILEDSVIGMRRYSKSRKNFDDKHSFSSTIRDLHNTVRAWGNHYSFCNSDSIFNDLDKKIDSMIAKYIKAYDKYKNMLNDSEIRRIFGVHLLSDSKKDRIYPIKDKPKSHKKANYISEIELLVKDYDLSAGEDKS